MRFYLFVALTGLAACTDFPDFDARISDSMRAAPYPRLQSIDPVLAAAAAQETAGQITAASQLAFDDRIARLRARASALRGPVVDQATRQRMRRGVAVPAAIR